MVPEHAQSYTRSRTVYRTRERATLRAACALRECARPAWRGGRLSARKLASKPRARREGPPCSAASWLSTRSVKLRSARRTVSDWCLLCSAVLLAHNPSLLPPFSRARLAERARRTAAAALATVTEELASAVNDGV